MDAAVGVAVDHTIPPILHQLGYIISYKANIKELEKQLGILRSTKETVQILVDQDKGKGNAIFDGVTKWFDNVKEVLDVTSQQNEYSSTPSCFNFVKRHQLSRKAKKRVQYILELVDEGKQFNKDNVGYPAPLPVTNSPALPLDYQIIESRMRMVEQIKDALADPNVNKVGVCGMGGVGKTKLLDEVKKSVLENNLFHRVIVVTVGTSKGVIEIQDEIGGILNIDLPGKNSKEVRASHLQTKLVKMKDTVLIMLDDLWKEYDLEKDFGIPCHSNQSKKEGCTCKILMTSRCRDILTNQIGTEKLFQVNPLSDEEAWKFFVAIVGEFEFVGDSRIQPIAKNVVKECGGLPIALKILAKRLKGKKVPVWNDALKKLKNHVFVGIQGVNDELYTCLKISYDSMEDEAKLLLRLCSVFPDDHEIYVKDLQMYAMGMGLLNNDIHKWEDARDRIFKVVDDLKSSNLLLETNRRDDYVRMHDVVRDVVKYITSNIDKMPSLTFGSIGQISEWREDDCFGAYNAIFVDCKYLLNLPPKVEFPDVELLILRNLGGHSKIIPNAFFEGMEKLRVLDMKGMSFEASRTLALTHSLKNLQTLCMSECDIDDIDTIGELKKLNILKIYGCRIPELLRQ